jgi:hypothetical protein
VRYSTALRASGVFAMYTSFRLRLWLRQGSALMLGSRAAQDSQAIYLFRRFERTNSSDSHRTDVAPSTARHSCIKALANRMSLERTSRHFHSTPFEASIPTRNHHHVRNNFGHHLRLSSQCIDARRHLLCILALQARYKQVDGI